MKHRALRPVLFSSLFSLFLLVPTLVACEDDTGGSTFTTLTQTQKNDLAFALPLAEKKTSFVISEQRLEEEAPYVLNGSDTIDAVYDTADNLIGYTRLVNTGVGCHDGACAAIKFVLVYDANLEYVHVYHPSGTTIGEFFKGLDDNTTDSTLFTEEDWSSLYGILADPPAILLALTDRLDMVDATTGATFEEYQGSVVHGAAYTTYSVLTYILHTQEIIQADILAEAK